MTSKSEETIFLEAIELPSEQRRDFVQRECGDNRALLQRLNQLLASHERPGGLLDAAGAQSVSGRLDGFDAGAQIGPYRLLQKLGEGGFGVVFLAEQRQPVRRTVALKVIKPGMDSEAVVARFEAERQALAMMDHPNIAQVFDGGSIDSHHRPYFVMELVQGMPIVDYCDSNSLTTAERLVLFRAVCNAVHHAHQKGVIHRDIKPSNVMVTVHDGRPVVKVIDFGVAKALHQRLTEKTLFTQYGMMVGTPQYMSPEQAEMSGLDVDTRSDVYSLAVLLYELLTGTTPLQLESLRQAGGYQELQRLICEEEPALPSQRVSTAGQRLTVLAKHRSITPDRLPREIRGDLDWIVMKGLEKDRRRRYDSASDFAADVQRALDLEPVHAGPPSTVYRVRKFVLRNRARVMVAAATAVVLFAMAFAMMISRNQQQALIRQDEIRLTNAVADATSALVMVADADAGDEGWAKADFAVSQVRSLLAASLASRETVDHAQEFLERYELARRDQQFVLAIQSLLINRGTNRDLGSWIIVERELRGIIRARGYDVDRLLPDELGSRMRDDSSMLQLTDALELWLDARQQVAALGGQKVEASDVKAWVGGMNAADPQPFRSALRELVFATVSPDPRRLEQAVATNELAATCSRKLSWLARAYRLVGEESKAEEIQAYALSRHPGDLLLNFEYATRRLANEDWEDSIRYYLRCTAIRPDVAGVWRSLSDAYRKNGEAEAANRAMAVATRLEQPR